MKQLNENNVLRGEERRRFLIALHESRSPAALRALHQLTLSTLAIKPRGFVYVMSKTILQHGIIDEWSCAQTHFEANIKVNQGSRSCTRALA